MKKLKPLATPLLTAFVCVFAWTPAQPQEAGSLVTVTLGDSTSIPLRNWELSYEYLAWPKGTPQFLAQTQTRPAPAIWVKKKTYPVAGQTLSIVYGPPRRGASVVKQLLLDGPTGKTQKLKPEPPHRELLSPGADKNQLVVARSLDLKGETVTGTKRSFCLVSYTALVECSADPDQQVTKITFE